MHGLPVTDVVAAVVLRDGYHLIAQRPLTKQHGGCWEFPGGKVEPGEGLEEALARELDEELGATLAFAGATLWVHDSETLRPGAPGALRIHFIEAALTGEPRCLEHLALAWVRLEHLTHRAMAQADAACVDHLLRLATHHS